LLPLLQEYVDAGGFTIKEKLKRSLKVNFMIYGTMALFGIVFIFYLQVSGRIGE